MDDPVAFFITWTVYGTLLQGHQSGWRSRTYGVQESNPNLEKWHRSRLKHPVILLKPAHRRVVYDAILEHCRHRGWYCWAANARTTHVHVVISAKNYSGKTVRDQLKANCTRRLREYWPEFHDRPVWTVGGDWRCINSDDDLEWVIGYVMEAQDRKWRDELPGA